MCDRHKVTFVNQRAMLIRDRGHRPRSLLGEMAVGMLASMAIGTGFSILAGAFVLILAGGRIEGSDAVGTQPPPSLQRIVLSQAGATTQDALRSHLFLDARQIAARATHHNGG